MNISAVTAFFDHSTSVQITWLILHFAWQGLAIGSLVFVLNLAITRQLPRLRYGIAVAGMLAMIASVVTTWVLMQSATPALELSEVVMPVDIGPAMQFDPALAMIDSELPTPPPNSQLKVWAPPTTAAYTIGVALMLLRLLFSTVFIGRLRWTSQRAGEELASRVSDLSQKIGVRTKPTLKTCERVVVPFVVSIIKPAILLPSCVATGMTQEELDAILLHELAHVRRGDLVVNFVQRVAESLLFFHPAVWYVSRQITVERENCCDDIVLAHCSQRVYASALIRLAEACADRKQGKQHEMAPIAMLAATGASPSQLKRRVMRILGVKPTRQFHKPGWGVLLACIIALTITAVHLHAQTNGDDAAVSTKTTEAEDAPYRPLTTTLSEDGSIVEFTADSGEMQRLTSILQHLSANQRVEITSSSISRKGNRLKMTIKGKNLDYRSTKSAVRKADAPLVEALVRNAEGELVDSTSTDEAASSTTDKLRVESLGDVVFTENHPELARIKDQITKLRSKIRKLEETGANGPDLNRLQLIDEQLKDRFGPDHPQRKAIARQIKRLKLIEESTNAEDDVADQMQLRSHKVDSGDPIVVLRVLETLFAGDTRIRLQANTGSILAYATAEQHQKIREAIAEIEPESTRTAVIPLQRIDPAQVVALVERLYGVNGEQGVKEAPIVDATYDPDQLIVKGSSAQIEQIRALLQQLGERPKMMEPEGDSGTNSVGPVRIEFLEETDVFITRGMKRDVDRVMAIIKEIEKQTAEGKTPDVEAIIDETGRQEAAEKPREGAAALTTGEEPNMDTDTSKPIGPVRFEIHGDDQFAIQGEKEDVDRVMKVVEKQWPKNKPNRKVTKKDRKDVKPVVTDPVLIEFIEGADIYVVRGKKEDVDLIMKVLQPPGEENNTKAKKPAGR